MYYSSQLVRVNEAMQKNDHSIPKEQKSSVSLYDKESKRPKIVLTDQTTN